MKGGKIIVSILTKFSAVNEKKILIKKKKRNESFNMEDKEEQIDSYIG